MLDAIRYTTKIRWGYDPTKQQPKRFVIRAGRSTGIYGTEVGPSSPHEREYGVEHLVYDGLGTYYVIVVAIDKDNNEEVSNEIVINIVDPSDGVIAPIAVSAY